MNVGSKSNQFASRSATIAARFVEDIYTLATLKQIRDQLKRLFFFVLICLVFSP